jgi:iron complex outermembrane receptor protein
LALIYNPTPKTSLKLLYGTAFRAPNAYEQYYGEDDALPFKVNPGLRPDNIRTTEAVVEHYLADGLRAVLSVYQYRVDDLITLQTDPADGKLVYENAGRVDAKGAELELDGKFAGSLEGRLSYTYQASTEYGSGGTPANSPRQTAKFGFTAPLVNDRLRGAIEVQYVGKRDTVKGIPVGGYALTNVTLLSRAVRRGLDLSAGIHNLFDKRYADPASAEHVQNAILQDGRTFWIKATCGF